MALASPGHYRPEPANVPRLADPLLTPEEVSTILAGTSTETLRRWRTDRRGPVPMHLGKRVFYRLSSVEEWLRQKDEEAANWMAS